MLTAPFCKWFRSGLNGYLNTFSSQGMTGALRMQAWQNHEAFGARLATWNQSEFIHFKIHKPGAHYPLQPHFLKVHRSKSEEQLLDDPSDKNNKVHQIGCVFPKTYRKWTWQRIIKDTAWQGPIAFTIILKCNAPKILKLNPCCLRSPRNFPVTCLQPCDTCRQTHIFQHDGTNCHHWHVFFVWWAEFLVDFHETTM